MPQLSENKRHSTDNVRIPAAGIGALQRTIIAEGDRVSAWNVSVGQEDAERLQLNHLGLCQDYGNLFSTLVMFFDPENPPEFQQRVLARVCERIQDLPSYAEHVARRIGEHGLSCSIGAVLEEAKGHGVDLGVFDRIIGQIRQIGFSPADRLEDPETLSKIFQLRLWAFLADEYLYEWGSEIAPPLAIFQLAPVEVASFRAAHQEIYKEAA